MRTDTDRWITYSIQTSLLIILLVLMGPPAAVGADGLTDLVDLSLEELMEIEITSVSKKPEKLKDAAAAIYVITSEDILRSGATTIAEVLRLAPGLNVARTNSNQWAISARGFINRFSNKLLVLLDGRTMYTPVFSGVFWDTLDTLIEDIDRIEIIRGPGASLWGANAVNGVINILTKHSKLTQKGLAKLGIGSEERGNMALRYGGTVQEDIFYRVYAAYFDRDGSVDAAGNDTGDDWRALRGGFRVDGRIFEDSEFSIDGGIYGGQTSYPWLVPTLSEPYSERIELEADVSGYHLLALCKREIDARSNTRLQLYYDHYERDDISFQAAVDIIDVEWQHQFGWGNSHDVIWGLGYRLVHDNLKEADVFSFEPNRSDTHLFSAFLQDEIVVIDKGLHLVLGTRLEHNAYTGFEIQPNVRLIGFLPNKDRIWSALSRAVRTPSRVDQDLVLNLATVPPSNTADPDAVPILVKMLGNDDFVSEEALTAELGYRTTIHKNLSLDLVSFYNDYANIQTWQIGTPFAADSSLPEHNIVPLTYENDVRGRSYGLEVLLDFSLADWWRLQWAYTYLELSMAGENAAADFIANQIEGLTPRTQASVFSRMDLGPAVSLDCFLKYVDELPYFKVDSYFDLDARVAFKITENIELSLTGRNLLAPYRLEFKEETSATPADSPLKAAQLDATNRIEREVFFNLVFRW